MRQPLQGRMGKRSVAALVLLLASAGGSSSLHSVQLSQKESPVESTPVAERGFRATLPGRWTKLERPKDGPLVFRCATRAEQLTISVFEFKTRPAQVDLKSTLQAMVEARRKAELAAGASEADLGSVSYGEVGQVQAARYNGAAPGGGHRFSNLLLCSTVGAWNFYLEALKVGEAAFNTEARAIMNSITVEGG